MAIMEPEKYSPELRMSLMDLETSIRAEIAAPTGGRIVTLGFPGLAFGITGDAYLDPDRMRATLTHAALRRCRLLVVLVEPGELPEGALDQLHGLCVALRLRLVHLPIEDYMVPGAAFNRGWSGIAPEIDALLRAGDTVALSCHYGAGRSGMIAAGLLIDQGMTLGDAILTLRAQFPDSIESDLQLAWLSAKSQRRG